MKTPASTALLALLVGAAAGQYSTLPTCAQDCASTALANLGCGLNPTCICGSGDFIKGITCCVACACDSNDQSAVLSYAQSICSANSVSELPTTVACTTSYSCSKSLTLASNTASATGSTTSGASGSVSSSTSSAGLPRQTAANLGMGMVGGLVAAAALL